MFSINLGRTATIADRNPGVSPYGYLPGNVPSGAAGGGTLSGVNYNYGTVGPGVSDAGRPLQPQITFQNRDDVAKAYMEQLNNVGYGIGANSVANQYQLGGQNALNQLNNVQNIASGYQVGGQNALNELGNLQNVASGYQTRGQDALNQLSSLRNIGDLYGQATSGLVMDPRALAQIQSEALRTPGSQSAWAQAMRSQLGNQAVSDRDLATQQALGSFGDAYSRLASIGGISSGSRERLASDSMRSRNMAQQGVTRGLSDQLAGVATTDEAQRQAQLMALPGLQAQQLAPQLAIAQNTAQFRQTDNANQIQKAQMASDYAKALAGYQLSDNTNVYNKAQMLSDYAKSLAGFQNTDNANIFNKAGMASEYAKALAGFQTSDAARALTAANTYAGLLNDKNLQTLEQDKAGNQFGAANYATAMGDWSNQQMANAYGNVYNGLPLNANNQYAYGTKVGPNGRPIGPDGKELPDPRVVFNPNQYVNAPEGRGMGNPSAYGEPNVY